MPQKQFSAIQVPVELGTEFRNEATSQNMKYIEYFEYLLKLGRKYPPVETKGSEDES